MHTHTHMHTNAHTHAYTHTSTHTHAHKRQHTHTYTRMKDRKRKCVKCVCGLALTSRQSLNVCSSMAPLSLQCYPLFFHHYHFLFYFFLSRHATISLRRYAQAWPHDLHVTCRRMKPESANSLPIPSLSLLAASFLFVFKHFPMIDQVIKCYYIRLTLFREVIRHCFWDHVAGKRNQVIGRGRGWLNGWRVWRGYGATTACTTSLENPLWMPWLSGRILSDHLCPG